MKLYYNSGEFLMFSIRTKHIKLEFRKTFDRILTHLKELEDEARKFKDSELNSDRVLVKNLLLEDKELDKDLLKGLPTVCNSYDELIYKIGINLIEYIHRKKLLHPGLSQLVNMDKIRWGNFWVTTED